MASDRDTLTATLARDIRNGDHRGEIGHAQSQRIAGGLIELGWRPPAQVIETHEELDALPDGTVVMDAPYPDGDVHQKLAEGNWAEPGFDPVFTTRVLSLPAVVLWSPGDAE